MDMYAPKLADTMRCPHSAIPEPTGLCIVTVGNSLRGDDGIAVALCDNLPERVLNGACRFDLGTYTNRLGECLHGHKAAIIIDSTCDGLSPGSVTIIDLNVMLDGQSTNIRSTHGFSVIDELKIVRETDRLPNRLIFFGVEIGEVNWKEEISPALNKKLPQLVSNLSFLVERILEALRKNA